MISLQLDHVADWLDDIEQAGARLDGLNFRISDAFRESKNRELRLKAVQQFRNKAAAMARALDAASYRIINIRAGAGSPPAPRMARAVMAMSADAPPALNSGESRLSVSVSGEIQLPEKSYSVQ
ncbi:MAG: SIMPL domain-containing protein [Mariprofundaceae bacterium]|nr:SIMPL domain-containing protein [Mariprofundaceae bacterium]